MVDIALALQRFLGAEASPARLSVARQIGAEVIEAWREGRITKAQALGAIAAIRQATTSACGLPRRPQSSAPPSRREPSRGESSLASRGESSLASRGESSLASRGESSLASRGESSLASRAEPRAPSDERDMSSAQGERRVSSSSMRAVASKKTIDAQASARNTSSVSELRCTCGASRDAMVPAGVQVVDEREYLELGTCPACGTTLCVRQWRLSSSAKWRCTVPSRLEPPSSSSVPVSRG